MSTTVIGHRSQYLYTRERRSNISVHNVQVADNNEYHTKAAKLIQKSLGRTNELDMFDKQSSNESKNAQATKAYQVWTTTVSALSAKLNTQLIAVKCDLKRQVRNHEKKFYKEHGTFPGKESDTEYGSLCKKLDDTKKLCHFWNACIAL